MKIFRNLFLLVILLIISVPLFILGQFGFIPFLSDILGATKPRDLGVRYTMADLKSGRAKSQVKHVIIKEKTTPEKSWQTFGSRKINNQFSQVEITAIMNNRPGAYYPYKNVQLKFNADGSGEISGALIKSRLPLYGATFNAPKIAVDFTMKFLPENPVFYLKGRASLKNNKVALFEPQRFEIGRMALPLNIFLSLAPKIIPDVYAMDIAGMSQELSKLQNKKALIIDFINSRLANITGFYAENAYFTENQLHYQGTLPEKEVVTE